jgi:signal transduction histidine kinase
MPDRALRSLPYFGLPPAKAFWQGIAAGLSMMAVVVIIRLAIDDAGYQIGPYQAMMLPSLMAAWFGGLYASLFVLVLATGATDFLFLTPKYSLGIGKPDDVVGLSLFAIQGVFVGFLGQAKLRLFRGINAAKSELERRVAERTHQLADTNRMLLSEATERERLNQELREHALQLERSNKELESFASVASHDLQEPLRKILAFGDRLNTKAGDALGDDARDYLERMLASAARMQVLINDLLSFSRVTTRAQPYVEVDLNRTLAAVLADLEARIERSGGAVTADPLPTIEADPTQMRQLLQNLLSNALKFSRPGVPPQVHVSTAGGEGDGGCVELVVRDNGIGFESKYSEKIFAIFQRLHGRGQYEGTGIGLAVCRKIAERHGGSITAASVPGEGSTFTIRLPVRQNGSAADSACPPAQAAPTTTSTRVADSPELVEVNS